MSEIELKRANVVKRVDSEDKAKALEAKADVRGCHWCLPQRATRQCAG